MEPVSISDKALARIAKSSKKAQQEELFDKPELQQRPQEEMDRDQRRSEGVFPIPQSVEMYPMSSGGYVNDSMIHTLEDFHNLSDNDLPELFGEPVSPEELHAFVLEYYGVDLTEDWAEEDKVEYMTVQDLADEITKRGIAGGNTTYNWSWWGPDMSFITLGDADAEPYGSGLILVSFGVYSNYRHAIRVESYAEEAPWYDLNLGVQINTNEGEISLYGADSEGYHFDVREDQTGTWEQDQSIDYDDIMKSLNWEDSDLHDIW